MEIIQIVSASYILLIVAAGLLAALTGSEANIRGLPAFAGLVACVICAITTLVEVG